MKFFESEFNANSRDMVELEVRGGVAEVMLLDTCSYEDFRAGRSYNFHEVYIPRTRVPHAGHWHLIILPNRLEFVNASCKLIRYN